MSMTLDELRDWHARRKYLANVPGLSQHAMDGWNQKHFRWCDGNGCHPFPPSLDAADESFPPNWVWRRHGNEGWHSYTSSGELLQAFAGETGNKVFDLYMLSMRSWEQEAAR